jgi:hypothetical protein
MKSEKEKVPGKKLLLISKKQSWYNEFYISMNRKKL